MSVRFANGGAYLVGRGWTVGVFLTEPWRFKRRLLERFVREVQFGPFALWTWDVLPVRRYGKTP